MTPALRPERVWAIAWRDLRHGSGGRGRLRLAALGLALLFPLAAVPSPQVWPQGEPPDEHAEARPYVHSESTVPTALDGVVRLHPGARVHVADGDPIVITGPFVEPELRRALEASVDDGSIAVRKFKPQIVLPGRSILIALLAVSLLLGPLAESLPGERSRRTLEVLLSAGVSHSEIVIGKWAAWTTAATTGAFVASLGACLAGIQQPGLWLAALPAFVGVGVALGMFLVRNSDDVVGGAAAPLRAIPALAVSTASLAWMLRHDPWMAASVPMGGPLLVAGAVVDGAGAIAAAWASAALSVAALLAATTRALGSLDPGRAVTSSPLPVTALAAVGWWLPVASPGVWALAGNPGAAGSIQSGLVAGAVVLALVGIGGALRGLSLGPLVIVGGLPAAVALGLGLELALHTFPVLSHPLVGGPIAERLVLPTGAAALAGVLGHTLLFRGIVLHGLGVLASALAWTLIVSPAAPAAGLLSGLALAEAGRRGGLAGAALAHVLWLLAATIQ